MLKVFTIAAAGVMTVMMLKRIMDQFLLQKSPVRAQAPGNSYPVTRLRQDPVTGVYYPEQ